MTLIADADAYLGPSGNRFFSSGYKRVSYDIADESARDNGYASSFKIIYPEDWSVKKNKLRPHLSSIDVMLMSARACGKILSTRNNFNFEISCITIRASKKPIEELDYIKISFDVISESENTLFFSGKVGNMSVNLEVIRHEEHDLQLSPAFNIEGFKHSVQSIKNIRIKSKFESEALVIKTINGERAKKLDYIDAFVSGLQLGQILLYELDDITREGSNNLWMRSVNFKFHSKETTSNSNHLDVVLENTTLIRKHDAEWRSADIVANLNHIQVKCSVTHQLNR